MDKAKDVVRRVVNRAIANGAEIVREIPAHPVSGTYDSWNGWRYLERGPAVPRAIIQPTRYVSKGDGAGRNVAAGAPIIKDFRSPRAAMVFLNRAISAKTSANAAYLVDLGDGEALPLNRAYERHFGEWPGERESGAYTYPRFWRASLKPGELNASNDE